MVRPCHGVAAVEGLLAYPASHPDAVPRQARVAEDLSGIAEELEAVSNAGVRFRFAVVL